MPFTFSHPALVLLIALLPRRWYSLTGLVAGASVPDFDYFIWLSIKSKYGHTWPGILYFDIPVGIVLTFLFHYVVRNALVANSPRFVQVRFGHLQSFSWGQHFTRRWPVVLACIAIGAASHLFWDAFTHLKGAFVQAMPVLQTNLHFGAYPWPLYNVLQHASTLAGGLVVLWAVWRVPVSSPISRKPDWRYWALLVAVVGAVIAIRVTTIRYYQVDNMIIVIAMSGTMLGLLLVPLLMKMLGWGTG